MDAKTASREARATDRTTSEDARATHTTASAGARVPSPTANEDAGDTKGKADPDEHRGALEADHPDQPGQANRNVPALDESGQPRDWVKICEDAIGANVDGSEGG